MYRFGPCMLHESSAHMMFYHQRCARRVLFSYIALCVPCNVCCACRALRVPGMEVVPIPMETALTHQLLGFIPVRLQAGINIYMQVFCRRPSPPSNPLSPVCWDVPQAVRCASSWADGHHSTCAPEITLGVSKKRIVRTASADAEVTSIRLPE